MIRLCYDLPPIHSLDINWTNVLLIIEKNSIEHNLRWKFYSNAAIVIQENYVYVINHNFIAILMQGRMN